MVLNEGNSSSHSGEVHYPSVLSPPKHAYLFHTEIAMLQRWALQFRLKDRERTLPAALDTWALPEHRIRGSDRSCHSKIKIPFHTAGPAF